MSQQRQALSASSVFAVLLGVVLLVLAGLFLFVSQRSPLKSHDASFINGFTLGVYFVFYLLASLWCFVGALAKWKRSVLGRPAS